MTHPVLNAGVTFQATATTQTVQIKPGPGTVHRLIVGCDYSGNSAIDVFVQLFDSPTTSVSTPRVAQRFTAGQVMPIEIDFELGIVARIQKLGTASGSICIVYS